MGKVTINQDSLKTFRDWKRHKVKEGNNIFRILPPYGDVEIHNNYPYRRWSIVWLQDPKTGRNLPWASPRTDGEDECPINEYNKLLTDKIENFDKKLKDAGMSKEAIKEKLKSLREVQWKIRLQHLYAYNACDKSGEVGILEIKTTAHKAMKKMMSQYIKDYGMDPTSLNADLQDDAGVWFNITREGEGKDTEYNVVFNQTKEKDENGRLIRRDDQAPLQDNIIEGYEDLGFDLNTVYRRKDYDELKAILLHNLSLIAEDVPHAVNIPGFEVDVVDNTPEPAPEPVTKQSKAKSTKPITLKIDNDVDDAIDAEATVTNADTIMDTKVTTTKAETPVVQETKTVEQPKIEVETPKAETPVVQETTTPAEGDADIWAMADDILGT